MPDLQLPPNYTTKLYWLPTKAHNKYVNDLPTVIWSETATLWLYVEDKTALNQGPTYRILTLDTDVWPQPWIPGELWLWPICMQKVKVKCKSVQNL